MRFAIKNQFHRQLASLFGSSFADSCVDNKHVKRLQEVINNSGFKEYISESDTLEDILACIHRYLRISYRSEYIYKNAIANELLLSRHTLEEAVMFQEFFALNCELDVLVANGTTTAYEIKTELDSLTRLPAQLQVYQTMFEYVYVVTHERFVPKVKDISAEHIGVMVLHTDGTFHTVREATSNIERMRAVHMFSSMRRAEHLAAIQDYYGFTPQLPNTLIYQECKRLFTDISPSKAHAYFLQALHTRRLKQHQVELVNNLDISVKALFLNKNLSKKNCQRLSACLKDKPLTYSCTSPTYAVNRTNWQPLPR